MLGNTPSKKEMPILIQNGIPHESTTEKSNLFAKNFSKSVVLTITVVNLKIINNRSKIMTIII